MDLQKKTAGGANQITDVKQFFIGITNSYLEFEEETLKLIDCMPNNTPEWISEQCKKLALQRQQLAAMDQQMFDILDLAGKEIAQDSRLFEYRVAFAKASMACNNLFQKLSALKINLKEPIASTTVTESASL